MKRETAKEIIEILVECSDKLKLTINMARSSSTPKEYEAFKRAVANIIASIGLDVIEPICAEHPDLRPY